MILHDFKKIKYKNIGFSVKMNINDKWLQNFWDIERIKTRFPTCFYTFQNTFLHVSKHVFTRFEKKNVIKYCQNIK